MTDNLDIFKQRTIEYGICDGLGGVLNSCKNKKQYIDLLLGSKGLDYVADSIAKGWGLAPQWIADNFKGLVNGQYISQQDGYDGELLTCYSGSFAPRTTNLGVFSSDVVLDIQMGRYVIIYATVGSKITLRGKGQCVVVMYGDVEVINESEGKVRLKQKGDRDEY